jgi:DnaJ-class molecular chaperone
VSRLRLPLRSLLSDQGFVIDYEHVSKLDIEIPTGNHGLRPANVECPDCKGTGQVDQHGGLRQKSCCRCAGRGWVKALAGR